MIECPICKGKGKIENPFHRYIVKRIMAKMLRKQGYSYRQIMRFLGYKSPRSIQVMLKNNGTK